ncbi:hypothetical protein DSAG12_00625 [Promethearchaeum syntrophicum]|uniref:Uncharacterized protein n=1 Tax=Promethearchaeum syntrophicum TaxID=2594042 RepID=A0A5B9D6N2_9ARCH|nr:hypothetical protein [Candidatus Prometheoarchaeum syntrophicum]QEE14808.1 hypothetical protein DSAG12_00625 [Candidatus Prometheoarchaeum syntrophicum]
MLKILLIIWGLLHNLLLILIFFLRFKGFEKNKDIIQKIGYFYLGLTPFAIIVWILSVLNERPSSNGIFCAIFLLYIGLEAIFDFILKIEFRNIWYLLVPYLILYYAVNYGIVMMIWAESQPWGIVLLVLWIIQLIANTISHRRPKEKIEILKLRDEKP